MKTFAYRLSRVFLPAIAAGIILVAGCASPGALNKTAAVGTDRPAGMPPGVPPAVTIPDSLALLPPPPAAGSTAFALDEAYSRNSLALRGTPAWTQAILDADLSFPNAAEIYACALGVPITPKDTPRLYRLLAMVMQYASDAAKPAKQYYRRSRPFMVNGEAMCTPQEKEHLAGNGSYPSGHNTIGAIWALILAELAPDRADAILARGQAYGAARMVCNVHWYSDTVQGRFLGSYTVAVLHAYPWFRDEMKAAAAELAAVRARGLKPSRDCSLEAKAMELQKALYR